MGLDRDVAWLDRDGDWQALTTLREKFQLLAVDTAFRESWRQAVEVLGGRALEVLQRIVAVTVRPEAVLTGRTAACLQFLTRHDFTLISARQFRYTPSTIREVWRYQWNVASLDSMADTATAQPNLPFPSCPMQCRRQPFPRSVGSRN